MAASLPTPAAPSAARAAAIMVVATACMAGTTFLAKAIGSGALGEPLHPLQVSHGRFLFAWLALAGLVAALRPALSAVNLKLHFVRTLCGWGGVTLMFAAVALIPLPDATAISFLSPVVTMLLAIPLLGERVGRWRWAAAGIAMLGAVILLRPGAGAIQIGALLAVGAALALGLEAIFIKRLTGLEPSIQTLFLNNSLGLAIASVAVLPVWVWPTGWQALALAGIGLLMVCGQALFLQALRRADASFVAPLFYLTLLFATLYDFWGFGLMPDATSLVGGAVLVAGAALLAWREGRRRAVSSQPPLKG